MVQAPQAYTFNNLFIKMAPKLQHIEYRVLGPKNNMNEAFYVGTLTERKRQAFLFKLPFLQMCFWSKLNMHSVTLVMLLNRFPSASVLVGGGGRFGVAYSTWLCSGVGVGVIAGAVPGHAGGGARAARGAAQRRAARALHRLLRLHSRGPRPQPVQQGRGRARQCLAHDAQRMDLLLLCGMRCLSPAMRPLHV